MYKKSKKVLDSPFDSPFELGGDDPVTHTLLMQLMPPGFNWLVDIENSALIDADSLAVASAIYSLRHYGILGQRYSKAWQQLRVTGNIKNKGMLALWYTMRSPIHGRGVFAAKSMPRGTQIAKVADPKWYWWISITAFGALVNHQTKGNCALRRAPDRSYWLHTLGRVPAHAELVSDYARAPWPFSSATTHFK